MCGRYKLDTPPDVLAEFFEFSEIPALIPRFNIAPTQPVGIVRANGQRRFGMVRWGLIPSWAKDPAIGNRMINARSETAATKPAFKDAIKYRRCLVPADGFYEWKKLNGRKQPYLIQTAGGGPFGFAGLWERWSSPESDVIESCTILTTEPNDLLAPVHDRMPVILAPEQFDRWLNPRQTDPAKLRELLRPYPSKAMAMYPVSSRVNRPVNDDRAVIERVEEDTGHDARSREDDAPTLFG